MHENLIKCNTLASNLNHIKITRGFKNIRIPGLDREWLLVLFIIIIIIYSGSIGLGEALGILFCFVLVSRLF